MMSQSKNQKPQQKGRKNPRRSTSDHEQNFAIQADTPDTRATKKRKMEDKCSKCGIEMIGKNLHINCTICDDKYCKSCSKIEDRATWEVLRAKKIRGVSWTCSPCEHSGGLKAFESISKKLEEHTTQMNDMQRDLNTKIDDQTSTLNDLIESKITEKFDKEKDSIIAEVKESVIGEVKDTITRSVEEAVSGAMKDMPKTSAQDPATLNINQLSPGSQIKRTVSRISTELEERAKRKTNIIILGVEETESIQKDECIQNDTERITKISKEVLKVSISSSDVKDIRRLGPPRQELHEIDENGTKRRPRAILMQLNSADKKEEIMRNAPKLRFSTYKDIAFRHDQTKLEREEFNKLRTKAQELEEKEQSGKHIYRVRGPPGNKRILRIEVLGGGQEGTKTEVKDL